uniref:Uncharacterized protein n=1 Tax=Globodera rostochiensis TaxID=31243 RepID=A0A914IDU8_GLORO
MKLKSVAFTVNVGTAGYVDIDTNLSRCARRNSTVKVRITNLDRRNDSKEFEMSKAELSARKSAVVLGFNIAPLSQKIFYFPQSSSILRFFQRRLVYYELEIECDYKDSEYKTQYIVFGSGVQLNGQNGINIPIYETEMLAFCEEDRIGLTIYNAERKKTYIDVTREFLLQNDAFNIDIVNETVRPIPQNGRGN